MSGLSFIYWIGGTIIFTILAFVFPAYKSCKACEEREMEDLLHYLRYWIVFAFLYAINPILSFIPYWNISFVFVCIMLWSPSMKGARFVYLKFLRKLLKKYEKAIDQGIKKV